MAPMPVESRAKNLPVQPLNRMDGAGRDAFAPHQPALTEASDRTAHMAHFSNTAGFHFLQDGKKAAQ